MAEKNEDAVSVEQVQRVLSAKEQPPETWSAEESEVLARYHRQLTEHEWVHDRSLSESLAFGAMFERVADESTLAALARIRQSVTSGEDPPVLGGPFCPTHVMAPPYPTASPTVEEVGEDARPYVDPGGGPVDSIAMAVPNLGTTFSNLALPSEGTLSQAVGLGRLASVNAATTPGSYTIHPPEAEYPWDVPVAGGTLEATNVAASIGAFHHTIAPGGGVPSTVEVAVDLSIGDGQEPFYMLVPARVGSPVLLQAFGVIHVLLMDTTGKESEARGTFLEHREFPSGPVGTVTVRPTLRVDASLQLGALSRGVWVSVEAHLEAQRWNIAPPPPLGERSGFVGIDLRSPDRSTRAIHPLLNPNGPIAVRRIAVSLCS